MPNMNLNPAQIEKVIKDADYPCSRNELVQHAEQHGADEQMLSMLRQLSDQKFNSSADVSKALGTLNRK